MTVELKANLWDFTGDIAPPLPPKKVKAIYDLIYY